MIVLPVGWTTACLADLAIAEPRAITDGPFGSNLKTADYTAKGPRVIRLQNIGELRFIDERAHISETHFEQLSTHSVEAYDLLIAGLGERLPRACLAPPSLGPAIVKADCFRVRLHAEVVPAFVCAILNSPQVRATASQQISGVGRPRLNLQKVRDIRLPIPPRAEQERIAAAIEEQFSRLDAGVAALEIARRKLKQMRAAILLAAVTGGILDQGTVPPLSGALPEGWSMQPLEKLILRLRNGIFVSRPVVEPIGRPILRISAVRPLALDVRDVRYVSRAAAPARADDFVLAEGDLLFTRYSGNPEYVGACAIVPPGAPSLLYPDKLIRVQVNTHLVEPRFIALAATAGITRQEIRRRVKTTAGQTGISGSDLKDVPFPVPPLHVQRHIADVVHELFAAVDRVEVDVVSSLARSLSLRSSILAAAFSGKLVPQDPDDESAPALLSRIAAVRTVSNGGAATQARTPRTPRPKITE